MIINVAEFEVPTQGENPSASIFVTLLLTMSCSASYLRRKLVLCVLPKGGGDMRNIIEELYYGNICPMDRQIVKGGDYSHLLHLLTRNEDSAWNQ